MTGFHRLSRRNGFSPYSYAEHLNQPICLKGLLANSCRTATTSLCGNKAFLNSWAPRHLLKTWLPN